jgi:ribose transport system ATP-binding protein
MTIDLDSPGVRAGAAPSALGDGIVLTGVRKSFGVTRALDGVNFRAARGEIHAVVGGNGSGKSTLAKVMAGVLPVDAGQVSVLGATPTSPNEARALGVGMVFQEVLVADECTITDNIFLGSDSLFSRSMPQHRKREAARALMAELSGLDIDPDTEVGALPLNLKQWIVIARAFLSEPKVLILDESSAALDLDSTERLFSKMRELRARGATIIIVTHRIAELIRISDRATVLRDGRDVGVLSRAEINERNILQLMTGRVQAREAPRAAVRAAAAGEIVMKAEGLKLWPASHDLTFQLKRGEIVGLAGLDGQGQSDFARVVAGVDEAAEGAPMALAGGAFAPVRSLSDAARLGVAYVSGDRKKEGTFPNLSIFENLLLPLYRRRPRGGALGVIDWGALGGVFNTEAERLSVKMGDRGDRIGSLSGGNQQKVLIGRAFALNPNILVLNDPARGIDIGAKSELYEQLRAFAALGKSVVFMSSEIEEFVGLCSRVLVFRNGTIFDEFIGSEIEPPEILHAMFGQTAGLSRRHVVEDMEAGGPEPVAPSVEAPVATPVDRPAVDPVAAVPAPAPFALTSPAFADGGLIPARYAEANRLSPPLVWTAPPPGTRSLALSVTDPDLPEAFNFPRAFAHWLVYDLPAGTRGLVEGASPGGPMPRGARELSSDFVTFKIPGFGRGWGGPWPPDRAHRYVFTLFALKVGELAIDPDADYASFAAAVLPVTITTATLIGVYGPAKAPLPSA